MPKRAWWICGLFAAEMVAIVLAFQVLASVECRQTSIVAACLGLRGAVVRTLCLGALLGVYLWVRAPARAQFSDMVGRRDGGRGWALLHGAAFVAVFIPLFVVEPAEMNAAFGVVFPVLAAGGLLAMSGGLLWLAAPGDWIGWLRGRVWLLMGVAAVALLLPDLAALLGPLWYWDSLTNVTFAAVAAVLSLFAGDLLVIPEAQVIGTRDFLVAVADSCSGIEGFALITVFLAVYAVLLRDTLRMGRFWAVVWPLALILSWLFNVVRITVLILIGIHGSPELAQNGFHSFAGWLFFILLSFAVLVGVNRVAWLHKDAVVPLADASLAEDEVAAKIVPFIVFMLSGVVAQAFWTAPEMAYPLQVLAMAAALWWARRPLMRVWAMPGAEAALAGLAIGAGWVMIAPAPETPSAALAGLAPVALAAWAAARIAGTVVLVPVIEELFFRGYVLARLDPGGGAGRVLAIAVSAGLFALLHGRWIAAGLAGVIFCLLYMRKGRLADAIAAHAVANAVIAAVAVWRGDWSLI